ncbi:MAG: polyprenyl synthetase family protein [Desulfobacterales bacterium]|nr:polyprenyl synthetase family protein [Desulfobacterales bacterium]
MTDLKLKILFKVRADLEEIETALAQNLNPYLDLVSETAKHILFSGGKRLRPLLMVLSARLCGYKGDQDKFYSTIFEYLHAATLLHDDLVDGASIRRGKPAAHSIFGASTAVLVGDFLLARGLSIAAGTQKIKVIEIIASITENMSQGEIHQLSKKEYVDMTENEYMEIIHRKTAVLIQGACHVGALLADAPMDRENALAEYGHHVGMAFQMADDLLDYTSDTTVLGKTVGADLREGKLTLPVIRAIENAPSESRRKMKQIILNKDFSTEEFQILTDMLRHYGGIDYTRKQAAEYIQRAKNAISIFEPSQTRETLMDIADYALKRKA